MHATDSVEPRAGPSTAAARRSVRAPPRVLGVFKAPRLTLGTLPQRKASSEANGWNSQRAALVSYVNIGNAIKSVLRDGVRVK